MSPDDSPRQTRKTSITWIIYGFVVVGIIGLIVWAMSNELARNPSRQASADLEPYGLVMITLTTNPYPPLPTGNVTLSFMPMDSRRRPVNLDALSYEYGLKGSDKVVGSATAEIMPDGSGMYMGNAVFPAVGDWWVRVKITKDNREAYVQFSVNAKPPQ